MAVVAIGGLLLGVVLLVVGFDYLHFLRTADAEALDICVNSPSMDCNPLVWKRCLLVGGLFTGFGVGLIAVRRRFVVTAKPARAVLPKAQARHLWLEGQ